MPQSRIHAETDKIKARELLSVFETLFEDEGLPVSAYEEPDRPDIWNLSVYCETGEADGVQASMESTAIKLSLNISFHQEDLPDQDWVAATLRDLTAVRASHFVIHGSHEMSAPKPHEIGILIDAGLAFGTGHHGTTAGCLDMFSQIAKQRSFENVLDLGTGSGVLAIAVAKNQRTNVLASDIDPVATQTATNNVMRNSVQPYVKCITANGMNHREITHRAPFDLVIANILAKPLQSMAYDIAKHTVPGGTIILSGLLPHQKRIILGTFRHHGLMFRKAHIRDNWLTLVLQKHKNR